MNSNIKLITWFVQKLKLFSKDDLEELIEHKKLVINHEKVKHSDLIINLANDVFAFKVKNLNMSKDIPYVYWIFNKTEKFITSYTEKNSKPSIFNLSTIKKIPFLLYPLTPLSFWSQGLILLTNDALMAYKLNFEKKYEIKHHYQILLNKKISPTEEEQILSTDLKINTNSPAEKIKLKFLDSTNLGASKGFWYYLVSYESNDFAIKRFFMKLNPTYKIVKLIKIGMAHLRLPPTLKAGTYIQLRSQDIKKFKKYLNINSII